MSPQRVQQKPKYPALMQTDEGEAALFQGHNLDPEEIERVCSVEILGDYPGHELHVTEEYFSYVPRIKNCSNWDGWGCDQEGEWHGHWFGIKPTDDPKNQFTQALRVRVP